MRRLTEVNYYGTFWMCKEVGRWMLADGGGGNIVNMSALGGGFLGTGRGNAAYSSTKGAIAALTKELACEWGDKGIRVNAVAPCWFQTEMNATSIFANKQFMDQVMTKLPMHRIGRPHELVGPIVFLASEASSMITGLVLARRRRRRGHVPDRVEAGIGVDVSSMRHADEDSVGPTTGSARGILGMPAGGSSADRSLEVGLLSGRTVPARHGALARPARSCGPRMSRSPRSPKTTSDCTNRSRRTTAISATSAPRTGAFRGWRRSWAAPSRWPRQIAVPSRV